MVMVVGDGGGPMAEGREVSNPSQTILRTVQYPDADTRWQRTTGHTGSLAWAGHIGLASSFLHSLKLRKDMYSHKPFILLH